LSCLELPIPQASMGSMFNEDTYISTVLVLGYFGVILALQFSNSMEHVRKAIVCSEPFASFFSRMQCYMAFV